MHDLRRILPLLLLLACVALPRAAAAQPITFGALPWGASPSAVRSAFEALGYKERGGDGGLLTFTSTDPTMDAVAVFGENGLSAVMMTTQAPQPHVVRLYHASIESFTGDYGPPVERSDSMLLWTRDGTSLSVSLAEPRAGRTRPAVIALYTGPGYQAEQDRREQQQRASAFPPLDERRWMTGYQSDVLRISMDRDRHTPLGAGVHRVWTKWEFADPIRSGDGGYEYDSTVDQVEYDCRNTRSRPLTMATYLRGRLLFSSDLPPAERTWTVLLPETVGETMLRAVCRALGER